MICTTVIGLEPGRIAYLWILLGSLEQLWGDLAVTGVDRLLS